MGPSRDIVNISIVGTGYVGLTTGLALAELGNHVILVDVIREKLETIEGGKAPFYEPGVEELIKKHIGSGMISTSMDLKQAVLSTDMTFIAVGTPPLSDGSMDNRFVASASEEIGRALLEKEPFHIVITKSTVIPGTTVGLVRTRIEELSGKKAGDGFGLAMCPEFLREGSAMQDSMKPDRVVIGAHDDRSYSALEEMFRPLDTRIIRTSPTTAEMIKYSSNSLLAAKISFANEVSRICEKVGVDVYEVMGGVGADSRISPQFLRAGAGFGGSCFPKDVSALIHLARQHGVTTPLLDGVMENNDIQPKHLVEVARNMVGSLHGLKISVLGLAFKPDTDDIRETRSLPVIKELLENGARVCATDPQAMENFKNIMPEITYFNDPQDAVNWGDILILMTEWPQFRGLNWHSNGGLKAVIDGRRTVSRKDLGDIEYWSIGMPLPERR